MTHSRFATDLVSCLLLSLDAIVLIVATVLSGRVRRRCDVGNFTAAPVCGISRRIIQSKMKKAGVA